MLKRALRGLVVGLLVLGLAVALVLIAAVDSTALVERDAAFSPATITVARRLLVSIGLHRLNPGEEASAALPVPLLDAAVNHWAVRALGGHGAFDLAGDRAEIRLSVPVAGSRLSRYVNVRLALIAIDGRPRLAGARIGSIPLSPAFADALFGLAAERWALVPDWRPVAEGIRRLRFDPRSGVVDVAWCWEPMVLDGLRSLAFTESDIERLRVAQEALAGLLDHHSPGARLPLVRVLGPLLRCCGEPTAQQRRAALLVLAVYLAGKDFALLAPAARRWPQPRQLRLTLLGRHDSAQHFAVSAALAAWAGERVAKAIGLYKEIEDARGSSGFSFADLAADEAGTRFGKLIAEESPRLLARLATLCETQLVPSLDGLPERLSEADLARRFARGDNADYRRLTGEIERRIAALPLYRGELGGATGCSGSG